MDPDKVVYKRQFKMDDLEVGFEKTADNMRLECFRGGPSDITRVIANAKQISENIILNCDHRSIKPEYVSPNKLQSRRFPDEKDIIYIQPSPAVEKVTQQLKSINQKETWIKGPEGIGKSFAILNFLLPFRAKDYEARILYINNPSEMLKDWRHYIFKELIYTIGIDIEKLNKDENGKVQLGFPPEKNLEGKLAEIYSHISGEENDAGAFKRIREFIRNLKTYYHTKSKKLVLICDQYTALDNVGENQKAATKLTEELFKLFDWRIYGSSAPVKIPSGSTSPGTDIFIEKSFSDGQAIQYLKLNLGDFGPALKLPEITMVYENSNEEIKQQEEKRVAELDGNDRNSQIESQSSTEEIKEEEEKRIADMNENEGKPEIEPHSKTWKDSYPDLFKIYEMTKFYPYDLELITTLVRKEIGSFETWDQVLREFRETRINEITTAHKSWVEKLQASDKESFYKSIFCLYMGVRKQGANEIFDPRLMFLSKKGIKFASKMIENALWIHYSQKKDFWKAINSDVLNQLNLYSELISHEPTLKKHMKGGALERVCELVLELINRRGQEFSLNCLNCDNRYEKVNIGKISHIRHFRTFKDLVTLLEDARQSNQKTVEVFIPIKENYGIVDLIVFDGRNNHQRIVLVQVTINICSHKPSDYQFLKEFETLKTSNDMKAFKVLASHIMERTELDGSVASLKVQSAGKPQFLDQIFFSPAFKKIQFSEKLEEEIGCCLGKLLKTTLRLKRKLDVQDVSLVMTD